MRLGILRHYFGTLLVAHDLDHKHIHNFFFPSLKNSPESVTCPLVFVKDAEGALYYPLRGPMDKVHNLSS